MGIYSLLQPVPPMRPLELGNYVFAGLIGVGGLFLGVRGSYMKALALTTIALSLFSPFWGLNYFGMVLLTKSLHYLVPLLAVGSGFMASFILSKLAVRNLRWVGQIIVMLMIGFLFYASTPGTRLALTGLSAYDQGEITSLETIQPFINSSIKGDTRIAYLLQYKYNINLPIVPQLKAFNGDALLLISGKNLEQGFLYGYDWVTSSTVLSELQSFDLVYSSEYMEARFRGGLRK
jgi:hypothetical protein